ncbi:AraC family transcriptional regulator [Viridibacillus arvi]|uniref:AraC family transcriptional regulator n=1 Tax=Viridibacillus arvi TaxID=263475 RepID=UPI0034D0092E
MEPIREIVVERRTYTSIQEKHSHRFAQLILPLQGELSIKTESKKLLLDPETIFFLPPECHHTFHSVERNEFLVLDIPHFMLNERQLQNRELSYELNNQWKGIRYLLLNELEQQSWNGSAVKELYPYISRCLIQEQQAKSITYIHDHYNENISVHDLAALEHYNRSYYSEWFLKETGQLPTVYIQDVRMKKAKELLRDTELPILHIAIQVGLEHQSSFTRLFQKHEGVTPSQYRKNQRQKNRECSIYDI